MSRALKKMPVLLPVLILAAIIAILQGHLRQVLTWIVLYIAFIYGTAFLMAVLAFVAKQQSDEPGLMSYLIMGICLLWSLSLIIWFFSIGHLIAFFDPQKRPWVNFQVRRRVRRIRKKLG